jgi:phosphoribosylanthranilate isomerase
MIVKICGITRSEDADAAVAAGADALGFNFYTGSPRYLEPAQAAAIVTPPNVLRVGVFVNDTPAHVAEVVDEAHLDVVQLHGAERSADYAPLRVWKARRVSLDHPPEADNAAEMLLLDGPAPGTGTGFDWTIAGSVHQPFLLAGGLRPDNVAAAIRAVHPAGVDSCSGVERSPGVKDHDKIAQFVRAARTALL